MKAAAALSLLAGAATAVAQNVQSKPFKLVLESDDKETNGQYVAACHSGAAIESLCIGGSGVTMHLNTTEGSTPTDGFSSPSGILTWTLPASKFPFESSHRCNNH
jgi:predicted cobalt transporter CbtA